MSAPPKLSSSLKQNINLLTDTGQALRQLKMKQKVIQVSVLIIFLSMLITAGSYFYWFAVNSQVSNHRAQLSSFENQLVTMADINRLAHVYSQRLTKIQQLQPQDENKFRPSNYLEQLLELSIDVDGQLKEAKYLPNEITGGFNLQQLLAVEQTFSGILDKQNQDVWTDTVVTDFKRDQEGNYIVTFTSLLNNPTEI